MYGSSVKIYQRTEVLTADPRRLVILCYENILGNLRLAKSCYASGEFEAKAQALQKSLDVICELRNALDFKKGGEIARNLDALYGYMNRRLLESDLRKDPRGIDEVIAMLQDLESAWKEIFYGKTGAGADEARSGMGPSPRPEQAAMNA